MKELLPERTQIRMTRIRGEVVGCYYVWEECDWEYQFDFKGASVEEALKNLKDILKEKKE